MASKTQSHKDPLKNLKPGSGESANIESDFGVHESDLNERNYASEGVKEQDPGHTPKHPIDADPGRRDSGVGGVRGRGASSGGDVDTDLIGFGGGGVSQSGPKGSVDTPDAVDGLTSDFDRGSEAEGRNQPRDKHMKLDDVPRGKGVTLDEKDTPDEFGADAIRNDADDTYRDATAGELSSGEASGTDPSSSSAKPRR